MDRVTTRRSPDRAGPLPYPTRATATEGFRDYVSWAPETDAALAHGTADYDLQGMFTNPTESQKSDARWEKHFELEEKLFALGLWKRRVFTATVDQFLAFLQYQYASVCSLPLLADATVVIDEVHSFDRGLFSALKQLLQQFDVPVLCMTATLPRQRRAELAEECRLTIYDKRPDELKTIADHPRYKIERVDGRVRAEKIVLDALENNKRVLWVVNQVRRAQEAARYWMRQTFPVHCYHSRFKLDHRRMRHQAVVPAFKGERGTPVLAITTQVCEMSLDLDADVLVTEEAPITALIQRMGRCNRQKLPAPDLLGKIVAYRPDDALPYSADQMRGVGDFLGHFAERNTVSQTDLENALERFGPAIIVPDKASRFLESGPYAQAGEETLRDIEERSVQAVLDSEVKQVLDLLDRRRPFDGFLVPVPKRLAHESHPKLPSYIAIAPHENYSELLGFCDHAVE